MWAGSGLTLLLAGSLVE